MALALGLALGSGLPGAFCPGFSWTTRASAQAVDDELRTLIPDTAVKDPQGWARQGVPAAAPTSSSSTATAPSPGPGTPASTGEAAPSPADVLPLVPDTELKPDSPLAALPDMDLPWPDEGFQLPAFVSLEPDADLAPALAEAKAELPPAQPARGKRRTAERTIVHQNRLTLAYPGETGNFPERGDMEKRFRELSALETASGKDQDNPAQVAVRARSDRDLLLRLFRIYGYYEAEVLQTVSGVVTGEKTATEGASNTPRVRFDITPGARYKFGRIDLAHLEDTGVDYAALRKSFAIQPGDPLHADAIVSEREHLDTALGETGYPFAKLGEPDLLVDDSRQEGDLTQPVTPGGKFRYGKVISGLPHYLSSRHLAKIARFKPGQMWKRSEVEDLRRAVLATGLVSSITVKPVVARPPTVTANGTDPGIADLQLALTKAPQRTIAGAIGYDTGEGFRLEGSWEHRNLFPPEGMLRFRGVIGTNEQLAGITFRRNNFGGRDRVFTVDLYADNANLTAYAARKVAFAATYERLTTLLFQKPWTWSVGFEAEGSQEREGVPSGITTGRVGYVTVALPVRAAFDHSDDLLDPTKGWRASLRVSPEVSRALGTYSHYARIQGDASAYVPVGGKIVLAARLRLGAMPGADIDDVAPSRRFYAGGGGSIRGYGYELVGPRNALGEPKGARSLYEGSFEARIKTGMFGGALSVVPFLDAGGADLDAMPHFRDIRYGAGLGVRWATGFGPVRVDVGTPLGRRPGESRVGVYVALGQAF